MVLLIITFEFVLCSLALSLVYESLQEHTMYLELAKN